jgi:hypothetical protein
VRHAENAVNAELLRSSYITLNELYDALGLEPTKLGEELGWMPDNMIDLRFSTKLATNNVPCIVVEYVVEPKQDFYRNIQ